ncbi:glycoside hydrolase superfamily [Paraphysoderma sedebokerense]|nr:glycoside hydrolase superfamily [Paraphysoderma sedebokerense]
MDARAFYFHGANAYYMSYRNLDLITSTLDSAKSNNISASVIRTWAFLDRKPDGFDVQYQSFDRNQSSGIVNQDDAKGLGASDRLIAEAKKRDKKLILVLTNNWDQYGGMDIYNDWFGKFHDDFYNTTSKQFEAYKNFTSALLNRKNHLTGVAYQDEPPFLHGTELANEPRCKSDDGDNAPRAPKEYTPSPTCNAQKITSWVDEASTHIKSIDTNHLVAIGDEGFGVNTPEEFKRGLSPGAQWPFQNTEGIDAAKNLALKNIDFGTFHLYPEEWIGKDHSNEVQNLTTNYINYQANIARQMKKPVLLEEYGSNDHGTERVNLYKSIQNAAANNSDIAGTMFWAFAAAQGTIDGDPRVVYASDISSLMGSHIKAMQDKNGSCKPNI